VADLVELNRRAVLVSVSIVDAVSPDDLGRPTPCADWTLGQLLSHMIGQHYGFAAAAQGRSQDAAVFASRPLGADPAAEYAASARHVVEAFAAPAVVEGEFYLPEIRDGVRVPAQLAIGFHLVDYVAHSWDVARSIGATVDFDDEVLAAAAQIAAAIPDASKSVDPGAAFRPSVATSSDSLLDQALAMMGRSPDWAPPVDQAFRG
jgi:uncharacterized protein (TIGR03086 family)